MTLMGYTQVCLPKTIGVELQDALSHWWQTEISTEQAKVIGQRIMRHAIEDWEVGGDYTAKEYVAVGKLFDAVVHWCYHRTCRNKRCGYRVVKNDKPTSKHVPLPISLRV